jgi:hypothetical protein
MEAARMAMQQSDLAERLAEVLNDAAAVEEMVRLSRGGRPAVEAVGRRLSGFRRSLTDTEKQHIGRMVRGKLAEIGLKPIRSARVRPGNLFSWGAVYGSADPAGLEQQSIEERRAAVAAWLHEVRAIVGKLPPRDVLATDALIAERRAEAAAEALKGY